MSACVVNEKGEMECSRLIVSDAQKREAVRIINDAPAVDLNTGRLENESSGSVVPILLIGAALWLAVR